MPITLHTIPATLPALHTLSIIQRQAFEDPHNALMELFFPLTVSPSRDACIDDAARRQLKWYTEDPTAVWVGVFDEEMSEERIGKGEGELLGAALWHVYDADPFSEGADGNGNGGHGHGDGGGGGHGDGECTWFPEGDQRVLANALMGQVLAPRAQYMRRPHMFLDILFTSPLARRRGVGRLLMSYGLDLGIERNLPCYIDATGMGRELYTKCGFVAGPKRELSIDGLEDVAGRVGELRDQLVPFEWWPMWKDKIGDLGVGLGEGGSPPWKEGV